MLCIVIYVTVYAQQTFISARTYHVTVCSSFMYMAELARRA